MKTEASKREVVLAPALAKRLRERRLATLHKAPQDFVFATASGQGLDYRRVGRAFRGSVRRAGLQARGRLSLHSLRHCQLGHTNPDRHPLNLRPPVQAADHAVAAREALEASYAPAASCPAHTGCERLRFYPALL